MVTGAGAVYYFGASKPAITEEEAAERRKARKEKKKAKKSGGASASGSGIAEKQDTAAPAAKPETSGRQCPRCHGASDTWAVTNT